MMVASIAIYRPDDISTLGFDYDVSFQPLIALLKQVGIEPTLPQRRLHPNWRDQPDQTSKLGYDVVEIPAKQFIEKQEHLEALGFQAWPEEEDLTSLLYETSARQ